MHSQSINEITGDLWDLARTIREKFPIAKLIFNGILWRRGFSHDFIKTLNNEISWMCDKNDIKFCDPNSAIFSSHFARDQIHLNKEGGLVFSEFVKKNSLRLLQR